jgi:DNA processing protein
LFPEKSKPVQSDPAERFAPELGESEQVVYRSIGEDETHIDQIIAKSGLPSSAVLSALLMLELKQLAKQLPGKYFVRLG